MASDSRYIRPEFLVSVLILVGTVFVYGQVVQFDFLNFDDPLYVTENPHVLGGLTVEGVAWGFSNFSDGNWIPLTWLSLMLDGMLYGSDPFGYHLTNVLWHAVNSILLFAVSRKMTGALWQSAFVAAMFALHPLHVESVAWVSERKDVLSAFWGILGLLAYDRYVRQPSGFRYVLLFICFCLSLLAKSMLVTFPFILLLMDFWPLGRFGLDIPDQGKSNWVIRLLPLVREKVPLFAVAAVFGGVTFWAQKSGGGVSSLELYPLSVRAANGLVAMVAYLSQVIWPLQLAAFYPHPGNSLPLWQVLGSGVLIVGATVIAVVNARKVPYLTVGWLWFVGTLVPVIGLIQVGGQAMADRYMYLPMIGISIILAWGGADAAKKLRLHRALVTAGVMTLLSLWTLQAHRQAGYWRNSVTLFEHALAVTHGNFVAHSNLGNALLETGSAHRAVSQFRQAVAIRPKSAMAHYNLGRGLTDVGASGMAMASYREALIRDPDYPGANGNLANLLTAEGRFEEALVYYRKEMDIAPDAPGPLGNMANLLAIRGEFDRAISLYERAISLDPQDAVVHGNYGLALKAVGALPQAAAHFAEAIRLDPSYAAAYLETGRILLQQGHSGAAEKFFRQARELDGSAGTSDPSVGGASVSATENRAGSH
ncbi:Tetratricopeptide TPR_2 repeat protein [Olavius algarvensis associated proteobacterium Delta 3]|nr:Tetratricopeptide TPR_2 repeat protein [Olavius algarvensis associated proteobacterium Delta 3]